MTPPLQKLPLHVVAEILGQLDTIQELGPPIRSLRIFHEAFFDNLHTIARRILTRQVPDGIIQYSLILLETTQIDVTDKEAVWDIAQRLREFDPSRPLPRLSLPQYAFISRNQVATAWMSQDMADELIPAINSVGFNHPPTTSDAEQFRLCRAFLRFQIMCNISCPVIPQELVRDPGRIRGFIWASSQWVNDQLVAIYVYLERRVSTAFDQLAAHNVEWAGARVYGGQSFDRSYRIQRMLCQGLPYLCSIARAKTFDERSKVLKPKKLPPNDPFAGTPYDRISVLMWATFPASEYLELNTWGVMRRGPPVSSYTAEDLEKEARATDGPQDSMASSSFRIWHTLHTDDSDMRYMDRTRSLFAYNMWDNEHLSVQQLQEICKKIVEQRTYFKRYGQEWTEKERRLSKRRMKDIHGAGGRGYWPQGGFDDFSGITNVRDRRREQLVMNWRIATENGEDDEYVSLYPSMSAQFKFQRWARREVLM